MKHRTKRFANRSTYTHDGSGLEQGVRELNAAFAELGSVVYFVRIGEYVKIGTTENLRKRSRQLKFGPTDILAIIPGDRSTEHEMHQRFAEHLAKGNEYFHPKPELVAYINEIRERGGVPPIAA